ncbi:MAG: transcription elongation factor GreA, partial [Elusimicrobiota bacterium]
MSETYLTREGFAKLTVELEDLNRQKMELAKEIGETREQGDLRENAGYAAARERQSFVLKRIDELAAKLRSAKIVEDLTVVKEDIRIGARATVVDTASGRKITYTLCGTDEA